MKIIHTLVAATVILVAACKKDVKPKAKAAPPEAKKDLDLSPAFAAPDAFKSALVKVFAGYTSIQSALAQDDLAAAKEAFSSMHAVLHMMPKEGLDSAANAYWDSTDVRIMAILHPMASADSLGTARVHFMDFSLVLSDAIEKFGVAGAGPVYRFHCPMARGNKGADWLQKDSLPANPYYGKSMLKCGELVRVLGG